MTAACPAAPDAYFGWDLGLRAGWALVGASGELIDSGSLRLPTSGHEGRRYDRFAAAVEGIIVPVADEMTTVLGYEYVCRWSGFSAAHTYGGFRGLLLAIACRLDIPVTRAPVGSVKKFATGNGNADKAAMTEAAEAAFGVTPSSDDEADAIWVAAWTRSEHSKEAEREHARRSEPGHRRRRAGPQVGQRRR